MGSSRIRKYSSENSALNDIKEKFINDELNNNLKTPIPIGIYCYDVITENDIISSQKTGLPIVVVKTKNYPLEKDDSKLN